MKEKKTGEKHNVNENQAKNKERKKSKRTKQ